jgi:hypothetical protein
LKFADGKITDVEIIIETSELAKLDIAARCRECSRAGPRGSVQLLVSFR